MNNIWRWLFVAVCGFCIVGNGFHPSSLLFLAAAVLVLPFSEVQQAVGKLKLSKPVSAVLAVVLLFAGIAMLPPAENKEPTVPQSGFTTTTTAENMTLTALATQTTEETRATTTRATTVATTKTTIVTTESSTTETATATTRTTVFATTKITTGTRATTTTTHPTTVVQPNRDTVVYRSKTGNRYHRSPNCGRMKNGTPLSLEEAEKNGLSPCGTCY